MSLGGWPSSGGQALESCAQSPFVGTSYQSDTRSSYLSPPIPPNHDDPDAIHLLRQIARQYDLAAGPQPVSPLGALTKLLLRQHPRVLRAARLAGEGRLVKNTEEELLTHLPDTTKRFRLSLMSVPSWLPLSGVCVCVPRGDVLWTKSVRWIFLALQTTQFHASPSPAQHSRTPPMERWKKRSRGLPHSRWAAATKKLRGQLRIMWTR